MAGAPLGNQNGAKGKRYRQALERALAHKHGSVEDGLFALAQIRVKRAIDDADPVAAAEIADRIDGKPAQSIAVGNEEDKPFVTKVIREIVRVADTNG